MRDVCPPLAPCSALRLECGVPDVWLVVSGQRMNDRIVGICRFSFLGHGDWIGMRSDAATRSDRLERQIGMLYAEDRLARRLAAFQSMLLPSIAAQTDGDFQLWILTSPELPAAWLARLRALCAPVPQIRIIVSDERTTEDALAAEVAAGDEDAMTLGRGMRSGLREAIHELAQYTAYDLEQTSEKARKGGAA